MISIFGRVPEFVGGGGGKRTKQSGMNEWVIDSVRACSAEALVPPERVVSKRCSGGRMASEHAAP